MSDKDFIFVVINLVEYIIISTIFIVGLWLDKTFRDSITCDIMGITYALMLPAQLYITRKLSGDKNDK